MLFHLTGASTSLAKSPEAPQPDPSKSLGGYISSSPVPNGELNSLFDLVSTYTIDKHRDEYVAIGLMMDFGRPDVDLNNVILKIIIGEDDICRFDVAAVTLTEDFAMEHIPNRYTQPMGVTFHNADFVRAYTDLKILTPASQGEEIALYPFDIVFQIEGECHTIEDTIKEFQKAFKYSTFSVIPLNDDTIRIKSLDNEIYNLECSYLASENFTAEFKRNFKNSGPTNSVLLTGKIEHGKGIGLWIRRRINTYKQSSNEQLVKQYLEGYKPSEIEKIEFCIEFE